MTFAFYGANSVENMQLSVSDPCEDLREEIYATLQKYDIDDDWACDIAKFAEYLCNEGCSM